MPQLRRRGSLRRRLRRRLSKAMQLNTCKFCLKLYELSHSKVLFVLCYYCCFQVTPNAVQAPLKQFSQCKSPSPLFTPVSFPRAVPVSEPVDVPQVCKEKQWTWHERCHPVHGNPPSLPPSARCHWHGASPAPGGVGMQEIPWYSLRIRYCWRGTHLTRKVELTPI